MKMHPSPGKLGVFATVVCVGVWALCSLPAPRPSVAVTPTDFKAGERVVERMVASVVENAIHSHDKGRHTASCAHNAEVSLCLAPGTPKEYADAVLARLPRRTTGIRPQFDIGGRWSSTATNGGTVGTGRPVTLTWSLMPDGSRAPNLSGTYGASNLFARMDSLFGGVANRNVWLTQFRNSFQRWSSLTGIRFVEVTDDGADFDPGNPGRNTNDPNLGGPRGDIRIAMRALDGVNGVLAFNYFPDFGDMVLDSGENWGSTTNTYRFMRNIVMHEMGHGLGFEHVESSNAVILMEPFLSTAIDGPQDDDTRAGMFNYGDPFESVTGGIPSETNNSAATAYPLGSLTGTTVQPLALTGRTDQDWFAIDLPNAGSLLSVTVTPVGASYNVGPQGGTQNAVNTLSIFNLNFEVRATNGTTILATGNSANAGASESLTDVNLSAAGNRCYVRVFTPSTGSGIQRYTLTLALRRPSVAGTITPQGALNNAQLVNFEFRPRNGEPSFTRQATLGSNGSYLITDLPAYEYDLAIKGRKYLRRVVPANLSAGDVTGINATLLVGDIAENNAVDFSDFTLLRLAFGSTPSSGAWNANADLNGDDQVNATDFALLRLNYGRVGDP